MKNPNIKSILEDIAQVVWSEPSLNRAKEIVQERVESSKINDDSKQAILQAIVPIKSKSKFDIYIANSLLKFNGLSVK